MSKRIQLLARATLIKELLNQEEAIQGVLNEAVERIEGALESIFESKRFDNLEERLKQYLLQFDDELAKRLNDILVEAIEKGIEAGTIQYLLITKEALKSADIPIKPFLTTQYRANQRAVDAVIARQINGLNLSDRIWSTSKKINHTLGQIAIDSLREGKHPVEAAKRMQRYVVAGKRTLVTEYPNMMDRIGDMLPDNLSYEALRLARTEMASAYGEAEKEKAAEAPYARGLKWETSNAGVTCDTCKDNENRITDLGVGIYRVEELPEYPAHPNCLCQLNPVTEDLVAYAKRLKQWRQDPSSQPDIEHWYKTVYLHGK